MDEASFFRVSGFKIPAAGKLKEIRVSAHIPHGFRA